MLSRHSTRRVRRTQGMTEYVIVVGLVGILLVAAVSDFRQKIHDTIMGSTGSIRDNVETPLDGGPGPSPGPGPGSPADGEPAGNDRDGTPMLHNGSGGYKYADGSAVPADKIP